MAHPSDELYGPIVRMGHKGGPITPLSAALLERRFTASRSGRNVVLGGPTRGRAHAARRLLADVSR